MHHSIHLEIARELQEEILLDSHNSWFHPRGPFGHFDGAYMKFINRNLNYFSLDTMISHAHELSPEYNTNLKKTRQFCEDIRVSINEPGPFGRMCFWKIPPRAAILRHWDNWPYHRSITRYILCISAESEKANIIIDDRPLPFSVVQGTLFNFYPARQYHSFTNNTDNDWYFLGFDYWVVDKLAAASVGVDIDAINNDTSRFESFGVKHQKYQSAH